MGLITTQVAGFGGPKPKTQQPADPKPVRGINWLGHPMKEGDYYGGRPEHMDPEQLRELPLAERRKLPDYAPLKKEVKEPGVGSGGYTRSEEVRQATRARAYAQHARKRAEADLRTLPEFRAKASERMKAWWASRKAEQMKKANPENSSG